MTITEGVIGMAILATSIAAALQTIVASSRTNQHALEWQVARRLIDATTAELAVLPYEDPSAPTGSIGAELGEASGPLAWDDLDDAHGWSGSPSTVTAPSGWAVRVVVAYASVSRPANDVATDQGLKRVSISAERQGRVIMSTVTLRGRH